MNARLIVDCSHGNSAKDHRKQKGVCEDVFKQILSGNQSIIGVMLESHLNEGKQSSNKPMCELAYGVSVTDACIDWATTEHLLREGAASLSAVLPNRFAQLKVSNG